MTSLVILKTFAKVWKSAIAVSDKFSATTWNVILLASILLLTLSVIEFRALVKTDSPIGSRTITWDQTTTQSYSPVGLRARRRVQGHCFSLADRQQSEFYLTTDASDVSGLSASTSYHDRVTSQDAAGNPATSGDFTFTTTSAPPPPPPNPIGVITDHNVYPEPAAPALPRAGGTFVDPTFGTTIMRVTDENDGTSNHNYYSYWPTFNLDSTRFFIWSDGSPRLYRLDTTNFQIVSKGPLFDQTLPCGGFMSTEDAEWSGTNANVLYGYNGLRLWAYDVSARIYSLVKDFTGEVAPGHLGQMSRSLDDNVFAFTKKDSNFSVTGYLVWRRDQNRILRNVSIGNYEKSQVDKSGRYLVVKAEIGGGIDFQIVDLSNGTVPPVISTVGPSSLTGLSAVIGWNTNDASDTQVEYGTTSAYGSATSLNTSMATGHRAAISALAASSTYHYRACSKDAAGNLANSGGFSVTSRAGGSTQTTQNVVWTVVSQCTVSGTSLQKASGRADDSDAGTASQQQIASGDGYGEFTAGANAEIRFCGLMQIITATQYQALDFANKLPEFGVAEVRENNVYRSKTTDAGSDGASAAHASEQSTPPTSSTDSSWATPGKLAFWILVLNAVSTAISTLIAAFVAISTSILAWIANYRSQADHILKSTETAIRVRDLDLRCQKMDLERRDMDLKEAEFELKVRQVELEMAKLQQQVVSA